jgi:molybdopterin-containing oxidoreductase family iron-sulfur binding subunit
MTRSSLGPTERGLVQKFLSIAPNARHFVHETVHDGPRRSAWENVYGAVGQVLPRFDQAKVILSLDSDFLGTDGAVLENIRLFAEGRQLDDNKHQEAQISRLYVVEGPMTVTGSNADHRIRLRPSSMGRLARALLKAVSGDASNLSAVVSESNLDGQLLTALAEDLDHHRGESLVVAGPHLPQGVHAAVALLNDELGAPRKVLEWSPVAHSLLVSDREEVETTFEQGVDVAILMDVNPVYDWPDRDFGPLLAKARLSVGHGPYRDETLSACSVALPSSHNLESWNDAEPRRGVSSLCQPVIAPLFNTRQAGESLLRWTQALFSEGNAICGFEDWHQYLQNRYVARLPSAATSATERRNRWEEALRNGGDFAASGIVQLPALNRTMASAMQVDLQPGQLELVIQPHHSLHDGRFANNGWLQFAAPSRPDSAGYGGRLGRNDAWSRPNGRRTDPRAGRWGKRGEPAWSARCIDSLCGHEGPGDEGGWISPARADAEGVLTARPPHRD